MVRTVLKKNNVRRLTLLNLTIKLSQSQEYEISSRRNT